MIYTVIVLFLCLKVGDMAPLNVQPQIQESASKFFYPGYQQIALPYSYPQLPYAQPQYPYQFSPKQNIQTLNPQENILLKQQSLQGAFISAIPFLPIHINIPDVLQNIIRGLQKIFGTNLPFIGNPTIITPQPSSAMTYSDPMMSLLGLNNRISNSEYIPIPIIIVVPQPLIPTPLQTIEDVDLKTNQ